MHNGSSFQGDSMLSFVNAHQVHAWCLRECGTASKYLLYTLSHLGVTIGLQQDAYSVDESDGDVSICAELINSQIERPVTVYLSILEYTALGMCTIPFSKGIKILSALVNPVLCIL